ncbi:MAG: hypothetical protein V1851_03060 [Patescibacteria group bacterium]
MSFPFETIKEKFLNVPEDVQEAISSSDTAEQLRLITEEYKLQLDDAEELTKEIGYLILGLKPEKDFIKNIQNTTGLSYEKSKQLSQDINNRIFGHIRESLKKIQSEHYEDEENLDEEEIKNEIFSELEKPKEEHMDIIIRPQELLEHENIKTSEQIIEKKIIPNQNPTLSTSKSTENELEKTTEINNQQEQVKGYDVDPYREQLD